MPITTVSVTGPILDSNGQPYQDVTILFTPGAVLGDEAEGATLANSPVTVTPDAAGAFDVDLAPGGGTPYTATLVMPGDIRDTKINLGRFFVPEAGPVALQELLDEYVPPSPPVPTVTQFNQAISDVNALAVTTEGYKDDAEAAAAASAGSASGAAGSATAAGASALAAAGSESGAATSEASAVASASSASASAATATAAAAGALASETAAGGSQAAAAASETAAGSSATSASSSAVAAASSADDAQTSEDNAATSAAASTSAAAASATSAAQALTSANNAESSESASATSQAAAAASATAAATSAGAAADAATEAEGYRDELTGLTVSASALPEDQDPTVDYDSETGDLAFAIPRADPRDFGTRENWITWAALGAPPVGYVARAGGIDWRYDGVTTAIADASGWTYHGKLTPDHMAPSTTTDWAAAFLAAAHFYGSTGGNSETPTTPVNLLDHEYPVSRIPTIIRDGVEIVGMGRQASVIVVSDPTGNVIQFGDDSSVYHNAALRHLKIKMASGVEKSSGYMVSIRRGKHVNIHDVDIREFYHGYEIFGGDRVTISATRGQNQTGVRATKAGHYIGLKYNAVDGEEPADIKIYFNRANSGGAGMAEAGLYVESADGLHEVGSNFNQFDYANHFATSSARPNIGGVLATSNYLDQSGINNLNFDGGGTVQNSQFNLNFYRAAGEDAIKANASTSFEDVKFSGGIVKAAQRRAINWASATSVGLAVSDLKSSKNLQNGTTGSEMLFASRAKLAGIDFRGGHAGAVCIDIDGVDGLPVINGMDFTQTDNGGHIDGAYTDGANFFYAPLDDDTVFEFAPPREGGFATITTYGAGGSLVKNDSARVLYETSPGGLDIEKLAAAYTGEGTGVVVSTSDLDETTATDGDVTIVVQDDVFRIVNRAGGKRLFAVTFS